MSDPAVTQSRQALYLRLGAVLAIIGAYMAVRTFLLAYPLICDHSAQDLAGQIRVSAARLVALAALSFLALRWWPKVRLGLHWKGAACAAVLFFWTTVFWILTGGSEPREFSHWGILFGWVAVNIVVGFWEELAFRGALMTGLEDLYGSTAALWVSALLFYYFHYGTCSEDFMYAAISFGVLFGRLRQNGMSLWWLAISHMLVNVTMDFFDHSEGVIMTNIGLIIWYWNRRIDLPPSPPPARGILTGGQK